MTISAQVLVENEENFVWFSIMSVIPFVNEVLVYDAGSVDKTPQILERLKKIYPEKIKLKRINKLSKTDYPKARNEMLNETSCDWILVLDGDEVWWRDSIENLISTIESKGNEIDTVVVGFTNSLGDLFHYQSEKASKYKIDGKVGNSTIKAINKKIPNLCVLRDYGKEGYFSGETLIQDLPQKRRLHLPGSSFLHLTHIVRTSKYNGKLKHEIGIEFPLDFYYPEAFFKDYPAEVKCPFYKRSAQAYMKGALRSPLVEMKRRL